ncbi:MAG: hypothetical protein SFY81_12850 [Verrucomicrobiota bacterium]|nr:hypothetical protein [Verrucomicrobiota bacterium]
MEPLPPIRTPVKSRWREFRVRFLPVIVFSGTLAIAIYLWSISVNPSTLLGEVEIVQSEIISPESAVLTNLFVERYQVVKAGEVLAELISTDTRVAGTEMSTLRTRLSLRDFQTGAILNRERTAFDYNAMKVEYLAHKIDLADYEAQLSIADALVERLKNGVGDQVISQNEYALELQRRDALRARAETTRSLLEEMNLRLLPSAYVTNTFSLAAELQLEDFMQDLREEEERLDDITHRKIVLRAPYDCVVARIHRRNGENLIAGEPIITLNATKAEKIIGYLRQPLPIIPAEGMQVQIRTRSLQRTEVVSSIAQVGRTYEVITNLSLLRPGFSQEVGLPIAVHVPAALATLLPGEIVELTLHSASQ